MEARDARPDGARHTMNALLDGAKLVVETDMVARGRAFGASAGHQAPDAAAEARLAAEAKSAARRYAGRAYDPENNASDRMYREEYERNLRRREEREAQLQHAEVALRDAKEATALVPEAGARPDFNPLLLVFGVAGVALSVGLALHDAIFARWFADPVQAVGASVAAGLIVGAIPTLGMLFGAGHVEERSHWEEGAAFGLGLLFGLAVYGLRVWVAEGDWANAMAWALALLEVVTVLVVKLYAVSLRREIGRWMERSRARTVAESAVAVRLVRVEELRQEMQALHDRAEAHRKRAAEADDLRVLVPLLEEAAIAAALKGYHEAVAANRGHVLGAAHLLESR